MGNAEKLLLVLVCSLVGFVGWQWMHAPRRPVPVAAAPTQQGEEETAAPAPQVVAPAAPRGPINDLEISMRSSSEPPPMRDLLDIRSRLIAGSSGTFIADMLAAQDSTLYRWPERRVDAIRVWVQSGRGTPGWNDGFESMARSVFNEWGATGSPLRFDFVVDTSHTDIKVRWIDSFGSRQIGSATRLVDQSGWIVGADIKIAIRDSAGRAFSPTELTGIVRHEVGHALGLGHSRDRRTLMFPEETMYDISPTDQATLRLLYTIPPGATNRP
jgi:hypothetical protein